MRLARPKQQQAGRLQHCPQRHRAPRPDHGQRRHRVHDADVRAAAGAADVMGLASELVPLHADVPAGCVERSRSSRRRSTPDMPSTRPMIFATGRLEATPLSNKGARGQSDACVHAGTVKAVKATPSGGADWITGAAPHAPDRRPGPSAKTSSTTLPACARTWRGRRCGRRSWTT